MTQTIAPRVRTLLLLMLAAAGLLLAGAGPASAHATLSGSDPQQGAVVDQAPGRVSLTFSEGVALSDDSVRVLAPDGKRVDSGEPSNVSGATVAVQLDSGLADGTYTVSYQVVSDDSHPISGGFTFSVGTPSATSVSASGPSAGGGVVGVLYGLGRYLSYAGFVVMVGGAAFVLACWQRGSGVRAVQRLVVSGWLTLTAATLALLLMRGSYTGSGKVGDFFDLNLLADVLETKTGAALVSRLLLVAAAALFIAVLFGAYDKREDQEKRDLTFGLTIGGTVVAAGLAASWAMSEHASAGLQPGIAMPVAVVHLLAVAAWLGGLTALLLALYRSPGTSVDTTAVRRFSALAFGSVVTLVVTGIYQSWRQLGSWSAFTETRYGQLLLIKIGLVALLVGVAWISRRWTARLTDTVAAKPQKQTVAATASGDSKRGASGGPKRAAQLARQQAAMDTARQKRLRDADPIRFGLRRSVLAEAGVAIVLLAVTTALTSTEPGRTAQDAAKAAASSSSPSSSTDASGALTLDISFDTGGEDGKGVVRIELDPASVGANEMHVYVQRPNGRAFDIPEVKVAFTLESQDIGPLPVVPDRIATGHWSAKGVQLPMAGDWKITVTVRTSDIDQTTVSKNAQIG
ncbi:copper resistance protein CopC [Streptomyces sp. P17]|uniref:copper resistance CopC/CopD family protein n=1 Tax=Streptomyces sp. P17 TaxID=3074716 RepID=UPI0028F446AC|nr:copper resistance protein CopC [Streptomyces sp. P17]MDT9695639.1 copper resistance protein CopC [Streptomyces sp. P17]